MTDKAFIIRANTPLREKVYKLTLSGDTGEITRPGQFVNLRLDGLYLRRPLSVCDVNKDALTLIYKVVGKGTEKLSAMLPGTKLSVLTGLGNGFDTALSGANPLLIGGGAGLSPLYMLAKQLLAEGKRVSVILGFNARDEVFFEDEFRALGCGVCVTTVKGDYGIKGYAADAIPEDCSYFYACGPEPMLEAVCRATDADGQLSFEARMGCGFGACMGCSCKTITGFKRICREGPVLQRGELLWGR